MSLSENRRWLSVPASTKGMKILDCENPSEPSSKNIETTHGANVTFVSSDGHWLIAGNKTSGGSPRYWDLSQPGKPSQELHQGFSSPKFSPDSKWLLDKDIEAGEIAIYDTSTWTKAYRGLSIVNKEWTGSCDWSNDSRMFASSMSNRKVRIVKVGTWEPVATLVAPIERSSQVLFSPDCGSLAVRQDEGGILMWDLVGLSRELAALGLSLDISRPTATPPISPDMAGPVREIQAGSLAPAMAESP